MTARDAGGPPERRAAPTSGAFARSPYPLVRVVVRKQLILLARYRLDTAARFASMFAFFALVFFGGRAVAGPAIADSLDGVVVGFFLWTLATVAFRGLASDLADEAQWGTLERLFLSPYRFGTVVAVKTGTNLCLSLAWAGAMLVAMMAVTGRWLHLDLPTVVPLAILTLAPVAGVGLLLGGLAVLYKRVENLFGLVSFGFVPLIAAPVDRVGMLKLLPMAHGSYLVRRAMEDGLHLLAVPAADLGLLVVTGGCYLFAGAYCLHRAQRRARRQGRLAQY